MSTITPVRQAALATVRARGTWQAQLDLGFTRRDDKTILSRRVHRGPLLVQRPFYPEDEVCHVYVIHPPGGIVGGDELQLSTDVASGAHALLTTPAAGKFYRSGGARVARVTQTLRVDGGILEWLPQENIFYPDSLVRLRTAIELKSPAKFIGWEIACFGLPARAAAFDAGEVYLGLELWSDERPLLLENLRIHPGCITSRWGFAGQHGHGTLLAFPATPEHLRAARAVDCADVALSCTLLDSVLVCRALVQRTDRLRQSFIEIWRQLRPSMLGRSPTPPRIWAT